MGIIVPFLLILLFFLWVQLMKLSIEIEHLRTGGKGAPKSVWEELFLKRISIHAWPGPLFAEFHDTEEIKRLIKRRNKVLGLFWGGWVIAAIFLIWN